MINYYLIKKNLLITIFLFAATILQAQTTIYVNKTATGNNNGSSWLNAYKELADALKYARQNASNWTSNTPLTILVAKGTYKPLYNAADANYTVTGGRENAFVLIKDVKLYGGFDPDNGITNLTHNRILPSFGTVGAGTILSGDIDNNGINDNNNTYHVVIAIGDTGTGLIDGFTVTGGYGKNEPGGDYTVVMGYTHLRKLYGGGIVLDRGSYASLIPGLLLQNMNIIKNSAGMGGGLYVNSSSPTIVNTYVSENEAVSGSGMIFNSSYAYSTYYPVLTNIVASNNIGGSYGCIRIEPDINLKLSNATIVNNQGYGLYNWYTSSIVETRNSIIYGNSMGSIGNRIPNIPIDIKYSLVQSITVQDNTNYNIEGTVNPQFVDASNRNYSLKAGSPLINSGNNSFFTGLNANTTDLKNNLRVYDYASSGKIDIGAYEYQGKPYTMPDVNGVLYVKKNAPIDKAWGNSWQTAFPELSDALKVAKTNTAIKEIWVAKGVYKPIYRADDLDNTNPLDRDNAFLLVKDVNVYGGFNGTELTLSGRDLTLSTNTSTLSGDLDDSNTLNDNDAYHVVISADDVGTALLDGFTITGGKANGSNNITVNGKAIARNQGGGVYNHSSSPLITQTTIRNNTASAGGGMFNTGNGAVPKITYSKFTQNQSTGSGAGFYHNAPSGMQITYTSFSGNQAGSQGGGVFINNSGSTLEMVNCEISGNNAVNNGGAIANWNGAKLGIYNTTIAGNTSIGGSVHNNSAPATPTLIANSIIWGNSSGIDGSGSPEISYSNIQGYSGGTGNINTDPLFINATNGNYSLDQVSPSIAKGSNILYLGLTTNTKDLAGNPRVYNQVNGGTIDMGAYEYQDLLTQTITFLALEDKSIGDASFNLIGTATSGKSISYSSSNTSVATVSDKTVSIKGAGVTTITASQTGDGDYKLATNIQQQLKVNGTLPIVFTDFAVKAEGNYAKLSWGTISEQNNKGFIIYRSNGNGEFVQIGEEKGNNNSSSLKSYSFYDRQPLNGNNYYKLVQVDNDSKTTELGIKFLTFSLQPLTFNLYPNPTVNKVNISFVEGKYSQIIIADVSGRVLQDIVIHPKEDYRVVSLGAYPLGTYLIKLLGKNGALTEKVLKLE